MTSWPFARTLAADPALLDCPYRGLQAFGEADADYYFGRDQERDLVVANLLATRLTILYGPSGVGKSSLLRAGVVRELRRLQAGSFGYLAVGRTVAVYHANWRGDPLTALGDALRAAIPLELRAGYVPPSGPLSLELVADVNRQLDADVFLVLDQFEEESLYCSRESTRALAVELGRIIAAQGTRANLLIGIREDALAKLDSLETYVPGLFDNTLRLDHLSAAAAREAIERPLLRFNAGRPVTAHVSIEPGLVTELLPQLQTGRLSVTDAGGGGGERAVTIETPFLQLVMTRLWAQERVLGSAVLRLSTLHALGDAEQIVRTHLDIVMAQLDSGQRQLAASVFRYLVTPSGMKIAHTADDLAEYAGLPDPTQLVPVLEELSAGRERILRPVEPPLDRPGAPRYEIFHDVLAPAILDWRRRFVAEQARAETEMRLIRERAEAERHHERTRRDLRRSRLFSVAMVVLLVVAIGAVFQGKRSEDSAKVADLLTTSADALDRDPAESLARAVEAHRLTASPRSETAIRTALEADRQRLRISAPDGYWDVIAFSPTGRTFVAAGSNPAALIYDVTTGRKVGEIVLAPGAKATWAAFSPDESMVALSTDQDGTTVYDLPGGAKLLGVQHGAYLASFRWTTIEGEQVLLGSGKGDSVEVWRPRTSQRAETYGESTLTDYDATLELSADGGKVVTAEVDYSGDVPVSTLVVREVATGKELAMSAPIEGDFANPMFLGTDAATIALWLKPSDKYWQPSYWHWRTTTEPTMSRYLSAEPSRMSSSADGKFVALVTDKVVRVFESDKTEAVDGLPLQSEIPSMVQFSPDATRVLTAGVGGKVQVWRLQGGGIEPESTLLGHHGEIANALFSPTNPRLVLTAGYDGTVRLWQLPDRPVAATASVWMVGADVSADASRIVSLSDSGDLTVTDVDGLATVESGEMGYSGKADFAGVRWLRDGKRAVVWAKSDFAPWVWDPDADSAVRQLDLHGDWTKSGVAVSPDRDLVAGGDYHNRVVVWNPDSGKIVQTLSGGDASFPIMDVEFVPHSNLIAAASVDGTVRLWNLDSPGSASTVVGKPGAAPVVGLAVSADGSRLAAISVNREMSLYRLSSRELGAAPLQVEVPTAGLSDLAFSGDGLQVIGAAGDGTVQVWQSDTGELLARLHPHGDSVNSVRVLPDGRYVTASDDGATVVWPCGVCQDFDSVLAAANERLAAHANESLAPLE